MKIFSLDIETTGLSERENQIIEVGGVIDDLENPKDIEELPEFHCYVTHDTYRVSEFCLGMHSETGIFDDLANRKEGKNYISVDELSYKLGEFVYNNYLEEDEKVDYNHIEDTFSWEDLVHEYEISDSDFFFPMEVVAAGKNFAAFDMTFLEGVPEFENLIRFHHRVMDPGPLYAKPSDEKVPNMETCMERAGLSGEVTHHAVDDSKVVVKLIRKHFGIDY